MSFNYVCLDVFYRQKLSRKTISYSDRFYEKTYNKNEKGQVYAIKEYHNQYFEIYTLHYARRGGVVEEHSARLREIGVRSPVKTDLSRSISF